MGLNCPPPHLLSRTLNRFQRKAPLSTSPSDHQVLSLLTGRFNSETTARSQEANQGGRTGHLIDETAIASRVAREAPSKGTPQMLVMKQLLSNTLSGKPAQRHVGRGFTLQSVGYEGLEA
ncbi:hypothetical protein NHX12_001700 [Muraenolepis orangiensis]|uniref:Uncharacterized protein n=1 Tax=Muraenolepis orangiensis TaxID=630683 RepID=A0A9Q0DYZ3_9TELE|nr:hypothetical protein NHX12_001700 [Muraenolepis orangiensis]